MSASAALTLSSPRRLSSSNFSPFLALRPDVEVKPLSFIPVTRCRGTNPILAFPPSLAGAPAARASLLSLTLY